MIFFLTFADPPVVCSARSISLQSLWIATSSATATPKGDPCLRFGLRSPTLLTLHFAHFEKSFGIRKSQKNITTTVFRFVELTYLQRCTLTKKANRMKPCCSKMYFYPYFKLTQFTGPLNHFSKII